MAVSQKTPNLLASHLMSAGLAIAPAIAAAQSPQFPHQQVICEANAKGGWQCSEQGAKAGPYPQPPKAEIKVRKPVEKSRGTKPAQTTAASNEWDWVPEEQLSESQRCAKTTHCDGAYIEPVADWPNADKSPKHAPLHIDANDSELAGETVILEGNIVLSQGNRVATTDSAHLDRASNELTLSGNVVVREPGLLVRGSNAAFNTQTGLGHIENAQMLQHSSGVRVTADLANRTAGSIIELEQASYTQCTPDSELWKMSASEMTLNNDTGRGTAKHTVVSIKDIPVFYSPYLNFPIDDRRKTGLLWPSLASGSNGFEVSAPLYLNLAPSFDATVAPRHISDRGSMAELELRYMNTFGQWQIAGAQLKDDDILGEDRWLGSINGTAAFAQYFQASVDYNKVSDDDYFKDLNIDSLAIKRQTHLNQNARLSFNSARWSASVLASDYQTIDDLYAEPYKRLPQVTLAHRSRKVNFSPNMILNGEFTDFDHKDAIEDGGHRVTGLRRFGEAGFSFPMRWAPGFIIPTAKVRHVSYDLDTLNGNDDTPSTTTPVASLDMGLFFERTLNFSQSSYLQTLEPRIYYLYSDYKEQSNQPLFDSSELAFSYNQLFRDTRFSGHDRLADANQASFGLTSRFIDNESGLETLTLSLGQTFYFKDRRVNATTVEQQVTDLARNDVISNSELAAEIKFQPLDQLWFTSSARWDSRQDYLNEAGFTFHATTDNNAIFNLGYRYRRDDIVVSALSPDTALLPGLITTPIIRHLDQADASFVFPISNSWRIMGRYQYDLDAERSLEEMVGIEYEDCCWLTRVIYQKAAEDEYLDGANSTRLENDHAVILQFQLKGLGGIGAQAVSLLKESIVGYQDSE